jgi:DNA-binding transcriptional LysR family regulator
MNIQQLRYLTEIVEQKLNLTKAAQALHTSQPGISRQIRLLEEELKVDLLVRQGNRIAALTEAGRSAVCATSTTCAVLGLRPPMKPRATW